MSEKLAILRSKHPSLRYESYSYQIEDDVCIISFHFILESILEKGFSFRPTIEIPLDLASLKKTSIENVERMIFLLGMVEMISYWKLACPEDIHIECGYLSPYELSWWEKLIRHGLGEFFFQNDIPPSLPFCLNVLDKSAVNKNSSQQSLEKVLSNASVMSEYEESEQKKAYLILVGGGKDSIVTLESLKKYKIKDKQSLCKVGTLCLNPIQASLDAVSLSAFDENIILKRKIDPQLIRCNEQGYLNGHTPFSALLSFASSLAALLNGFTHVLSSNESSASEGNVVFHGYEINHQYSKSYSYEKDFREYMTYLDIPVSYLSFLRPLNEIQIAGLFSQAKAYHELFRSCNVKQTAKARQGSQVTSWCGSCPKCVFTFVCLSCFLSLDELENIFGDLILLREENLPFVRDLLGEGAYKPFECVGTPEEVLAGVISFLEKIQERNIANSNVLVALEALVTIEDEGSPLSALLVQWNKDNFLPKDLEAMLREDLKKLNKK